MVPISPRLQNPPVTDPRLKNGAPTKRKTTTGAEGFVIDRKIEAGGLIDDVLDIIGLEMDSSGDRILDDAVLGAPGKSDGHVLIAGLRSAVFGRRNTDAAIEQELLGIVNHVSSLPVPQVFRNNCA